MAFRGCFIFFFPMLFSVATIVIALITFLGCYEHAWGLRHVYYLKIDFSKASIEGVSLAKEAESIGIASVYQIGNNGYCYGYANSDGSSNITACKTPNTPFWFDILSFAEDQSTEISKVLKSIDLPKEVTDYEGVLKNASYTMWGCWIATMCLSFIQVFVGFFAFNSRGCSCFSFLLSILSFVAAIIAAGIATGMYSIYDSKINDYLGQFGVTASFATSGTALAWVTVGLALISGVFWLVSICVGSTRIRHQRLPNPEDEKAFLSYRPVH